jgi:hypothetical protein
LIGYAASHNPFSGMADALLAARVIHEDMRHGEVEMNPALVCVSSNSGHACPSNASDTERVDHFEIDHSFKLGLLLHGQIGESDSPNYLSTSRVTCAT